MIILKKYSEIKYKICTFEINVCLWNLEYTDQKLEK